MIYRGLKASLATKHAKENILTKPFARVLGLEITVPTGLDTDVLGTFTGEIPRTGSMKEVVIQKAIMGLNASGLSLGLANEGTFGPHPQNPFVGCDDEMLVFVDQQQGFEVFERILSAQTNFAHFETNHIDTLDSFLKAIGFPQHGVIVKPKNSQTTDLLFKGIQDYALLKKAIQHCVIASAENLAHIETDMRAHMNPTRQKVIRKLAFKMLRRLETACPACDLPGFGIVDVKLGLPCALCRMPTTLVAFEILGCVKCAYQKKVTRKDQANKADPRFCYYCNP